VSFVETHALWSAAQRSAALEVEREIQARGLTVVRLSFADQHGILRGKTVTADAAPHALGNGVSVTTTLLAKDTAHRTAFPVFTAGGGFGMREMEGAADMLIVPDPTSFRVLPWAPHTGWLLCDLYFGDGTPVPFSTRQLQRRVLDRLGEAGYDFVAGLEIELHLFKLLDPKLEPRDAGQPGTPPSVALLTQGYQYLTEQRYDDLDPILEILRRDLIALGLKLRSLEVEYGPSQVELTLQPGIGLEPADTMVLLRSATKQIARRHGYHASFMCRPQLPNVMSSGWHLHQSLRDRRTGDNAFVGRASDLLSPVARHYLAGLLAHARGRLHDADDQRLQALPALFAGTRPRDLGPRQSRRDDPRAVRPRRSRDAAREPRRRAGRESLSLHGGADRLGPRRARGRARSRAVGRHAV
jgi:glutamine synthetase